MKSMHPHPVAFAGFYLGGVALAILGIFLFQFSFLAGAAGVVIGAFIFSLAELLRRAETFYILEGGVERGYKLLSTSREFVDYQKIQDLDIQQSFLQTWFGIGNINFDTAGTDQIELHFYAVRDPYGLERLIRDRMVAVTEGRGVPLQNPGL